MVFPTAAILIAKVRNVAILILETQIAATHGVALIVVPPFAAILIVETQIAATHDVALLVVPPFAARNAVSLPESLVHDAPHEVSRAAVP